MAFDSGFLACTAFELQNRMTGGRIDKIRQPSKDEIVLGVRVEGRNENLLIAAGAGNPRINLTELSFENPAVPFGFCQLLRKHLTGAKITAICQKGFERVLEFELETRDEMGFTGKEYLIAEIMGKYSNLMLCDKEHKIIRPLRPVDFTTSHKRQVLPGMAYELPPAQDKLDPFEETRAGFESAYESSGTAADKFIVGRYAGISPLTAREIAYRSDNSGGTLWDEFSNVLCMIKDRDFEPVVLFDEKGKPFEYSFFDVRQYGNTAKKKYDSVGKAVDEFFEKRERSERVKQKASDVIRLISNADSRLKKKKLLLEEELERCGEKDKYKLYGDLITANIYRLKDFGGKEEFPDYSSGEEVMVAVPLDRRLSAAQNAQRYYKKYAKLKNGEIEISKQLKLAEAELEYIEAVGESLNMAENEADLIDIRRELHKSGYASRMKSGAAGSRAGRAKSAPAEYRTSGGYTVLCGKNNTQNDELTLHLAEKDDWWFHVKNAPGSHVVMLCGGEEPPAEDFTQAAVIAATCSSLRDGRHVDVDYTKVRYIKKPASSKPGFVIYKTNYSAVVDPDPALIKELRIK